MSDHPHQPVVIYGIEIPADVNVEYPVRLAGLDAPTQSLKRHVRTALWSESPTEVDEINLIDGRQQLGNRTLDDLIFQSRNAQRPFSAIRLGNVCAENRHWPVVPAVNALVQCKKITLQVLPVRFHCYTVNTSTCRGSLPPIRSFKRRDVHVMQQACELQPTMVSCSLIHAHEMREGGSPTLHLALHRPLRTLFQPIPFLHHLVAFGDFLDNTNRSDFRRPKTASFGFPSLTMPDSESAVAGPPRFRCKPFARELALDPGGATPSCIATAHMLPSLHSTNSASATFLITWLNPSPHAISVYASDGTLPHRPQDSIPACLLRR